MFIYLESVLGHVAVLFSGCKLYAFAKASTRWRYCHLKLLSAGLPVAGGKTCFTAVRG